MIKGFRALQCKRGHTLEVTSVTRKNGYKECKVCRNLLKRNWRHHKPEKEAAFKRAARLRDFGLTPEAYEDILRKQNFCCKICNTPQDPSARRLAVDHDHKTGEVRGLLCVCCNTGLGKFRDSPELLRAAIEYLRNYD